MMILLMACHPGPGPSTPIDEVVYLDLKAYESRGDNLAGLTYENQEPLIEDVVRSPKEQQVYAWLQEMTLEDKVGQLFFLDFAAVKPALVDFNDLNLFLQEYPVGGFIYFNENIKNQDQVSSLNGSLQAYFDQLDKPPVFIGVDQEGGRVSRLNKADLQVTALPPAASLVDYDLDQVYRMGQTLGQEMEVLGFNVNFAPVLDVNNNPYNRVIGNRAYSDQADQVAAYGCAFSRGLEESLLSFGKHFPGHGNTLGDSHHQGVLSPIDKEDFYAVEGKPFIEAIDQGISGIMLGHIQVPNLVEESQVASLNRDLIDFLRSDLGFEGLIITDSLQMKAVTSDYKSDQLALMAFEAGVDLILMPEDFHLAFSSLVEAFQLDVLSEEDLDEVLVRILSYKYDMKYK